jgi:predicted O-methyltransferase YrrM
MKHTIESIKQKIYHRIIPVNPFNTLYLLIKSVFRFQYEKKYNLNYLNQYYTNEYASGPIQRDEAIFMFGLLKMIRPNVCLEFGFLRGHSAYTILNAIADDAALYSIDNDRYANDVAGKYVKKYKNFKFINKNQDEISQVDFDNKKIDFVLFDASHELKFNIASYKIIQPSLSKNAFIVIHDTGLWNKKLMRNNRYNELKNIDYKEVEGNIAHQINERRFANWIITEKPEYGILHFHTLNIIRHGLTVISNQNKILSI